MAPARPPDAAATRWGWSVVALAVALAVAIAVGLEAVQLLIPMRGADMSAPLIAVGGGVAGVLLYGRFVSTFIAGPKPTDEERSPWLTT